MRHADSTAPAGVALAVVRFADNVLVGRRSAASHLGGMLEFPGGKLAAGETPEQVMRRELREEVGLGLSHVQCLVDFIWDYPDRSLYLHVFLCPLSVPFSVSAPWFWHPVICLDPTAFPAANERIIGLLQTQMTQKCQAGGPESII